MGSNIESNNNKTPIGKIIAAITFIGVLIGIWSNYYTIKDNLFPTAIIDETPADDIVNNATETPLPTLIPNPDAVPAEFAVAETTVSPTPTPVTSITIKGVKYSTSLKELYLDSLNLTNSDIKPLKHMINLTWLKLMENEISDISPLAGLTNLIWLDLGNNEISDINPLAELTNLVGLGLDYNQISDISPLAGLTNLEYLYLWNNPLTQAQIDNLQRALPDCEIFFN